MAPAFLTIRNLTATPLELTRVERLEGDPVPSPGGLANITTTITSFFNATATPPAVAPRPDAAPVSAEDASDVVLAPFTSRATAVRAADPAREVLRLTFAEPGTAHRYVVDAPAPSPRSVVMRRAGGGGGPDPAAPHEFTAIYVAAGATLAVFSSAALASWMATLPDAVPLAALSVPGTHNSPACHTALPSVRCQAVGVRAQLDAGVRFLDVRVSCAGAASSDLALVHSAFPVSLTGARWLADLLADVYGFLDAQPRETVLVSLKREGTGRGSDADLSRHLHARYCVPAGRWHTAPHVPTLGEARGKVVLVRRFGLDDGLRAEQPGWGGIDGSAWPDNCADGTVGSGLLRVQDFYEVEQAGNIDKKIELARAHLERAGEARPEQPGPVFINFLSASNFFNASCWPERIAARLNPAIIEYLCIRHGEAGKGPGGLSVGVAATGVVVTDWVGVDGDWDLLRCIVGWNARLQLKQ